jgi:hypothetical protein
MESQKTFKHSSLAELEAAKNTFKKSDGWIVFPTDDFKRLCQGFVAFKEDKSLPEENHYAPMYDDNDTLCVEIDHDTFYSFLQSKKEFDNSESTVFQCDNPKKLRIGFVVYPQREWHVFHAHKITTKDTEHEDYAQFVLEREQWFKKKKDSA